MMQKGIEESLMDGVAAVRFITSEEACEDENKS